MVLLRAYLIFLDNMMLSMYNEHAYVSCHWLFGLQSKSSRVSLISCGKIGSLRMQFWVFAILNILHLASKDVLHRIEHLRL